jgi:hypothetical protein
MAQSSDPFAMKILREDEKEVLQFVLDAVIYS